MNKDRRIRINPPEADKYDEKDSRLNKCTVQRFIEQKQHTQKISKPLFEMATLLFGFLS